MSHIWQLKNARNSFREFCKKEVIKKNIKKGVTLVGFGSFKIVKRKARIGRNPQTGEKIKIKAKNVVKFKAGSDLASSVN